MTPLKAIRARCLECQETAAEVRRCPSSDCALHDRRFGKGFKANLKAIREKCLECCGDSKHEVKLCVCDDCPLYPYRFGKNPSIKRVLTDEQRQALADRLAEVRNRRQCSKNAPVQGN